MSNLITKTKRLELRILRATDYLLWVAFWSQMRPSQNQWDMAKEENKDLSRAAFAKLLKFQKKLRDEDKFYDFAVFRKSDGAMVGAVALMDVSRGVFHNAYLGYSISNQFWSKGYGKEAVEACLKLGFQELALHRIEAGIAPHNRRSIALAKSLKMRKEGRKQKALFLDQAWQDIMVYALTCEDLGLKFKGQKQIKHTRRR